MKKIISLVVAMLMVVALFAACNNADTDESKTPGDTQSADAAKGPFDDVEPLKDEVEIRVATLSGMTYGVIPYLIDELGGFEKANIKFDGKGQVYGNGSILIEASDSWDVGTTGLGGMMTGPISKNVIITALSARDEGNTVIWAQKDVNIAKAGEKTYGEYKLYGTAAEWKGQEVFYPKGTTLHYVLATALGLMDLKLDDVKSTQMEVPSVNTALRAGTCKVGGTWGSLSLAADMRDKFVPVVEAMNVGCNLPCGLYWNPKFYEAHYDAVVKYVELYFRAIDWVYQSEDNANKLLEVWNDWNSTESVPSREEVNAKYLVDKDSRHYSLKENYDAFKTEYTSKDGKKMTQFESVVYEPLAFLVSVGSFKEDTLGKFLDNKCKSDAVIEVYENIFQGKDTYYSGIDWLENFEPNI